MTPEILFFLVASVTVLVTRLWLHFTKISSPRPRGFKLHHYMYGLVVAIIAISFSSVVMYGVGVGLIIDELPLFIRYKNSHFHWKEYNSLYARVGVLACLILVWFLKQQILFFN